ncbi:thiazole synthase (plasmid) [Candidatus Pantoea edessiphila]|uniref:Thiazole synthase n=1 Tax=Candidatus Pantoea edessiphila TaxID=2044610 RepID=A0A2P5SX89_9GAMM|nr:thiazole synthase [Candidatus Pantoea edessiphila]MBK4775896.1 thiazole synthase [Pantoea sp. Edef]PPI86951.1 thiazole synthase [Candidatus Pantoea edessiphila]
MFSIHDTNFQSRLFIGTGKFSNNELMLKSIYASGSELVTLAMRRLKLNNNDDYFLKALNKTGLRLLPNTSGAKTAEEAIFAARLAKEALNTCWIKLEIHPDIQYLLPDPIETLKAANNLVKEGFVVLPYCTADPLLCRRLVEAGCSAVMPLGSPIGSNQGLQTKEFLQIIIEQTKVPVIIDAGIGTPSQAVEALEIGADAVMINTAIATAKDPITMAKAFKLAVLTGELAQKGGLGVIDHKANSTSPLTEFLFDKTTKKK